MVEGARRRGGTVRLRVTLLATAAVLLVLATTSVLVVRAQRQVLTESIDETLEARADDLLGRLDDGIPASTPLGTSDEDDIAQVVDADGTVIASTLNVAGGPPVFVLDAGVDDARGQVDAPAADEDPFRLLVRRHEDGQVVIVGRSFDDVLESTRALTRSLLVAVPAATLLLAALVWWLVGRTLQPVEAIRREVDAIGGVAGADLARRVPEPDGDDEIARLARTMNRMLGRVEHASKRQQQFVADASHELRSPLTRIRSEIEVDLAHPATADHAKTNRSVLDETIGMQRLVDDLLHLARGDAATASVRRDAVDLDDIVLREAERVRADGMAVDTAGVSAAQVPGDAQQLARAVRNLADNARRHARTQVTFDVAERDGHAVVRVADDGPGIPADERDRVFERFTRLDGARSVDDGGTGLGLAIVREVVEHHGGTVAIDPDHAPGARIVIVLPTG